ncbi:MAG TPA: zf-HC2 domain-containing protein [Candidatus Limnocylindria bacterium]|jgi:anti-sigma factor RsiW|nr:zf-HC2 domain-containing protein [Candidatus Limnocylindria bacterium]
MGIVHLSSEEISALIDGELVPADERRARQHLGECESCSAEYALSFRLDQELRQPPILSCDQVLELLSASLDREANEAEQAAGQRHLAGCADCQASVRSWSAMTAAIRALPVLAPHVRVDLAIRELAETPRLRPLAPVRGVAARALIAVTAVIAIVVAGLGTGARPQTALVPNPSDRVLVAGAQQVVFNARNNTLYVLDVMSAAVDAREPSSNELKVRIPVGGEPTALALNEVANTILVLDSGQKRVTEIDASSNTVIGATTVALTGTPTSISVDPGTNNIIVATVSGSGPAAQRSPSGAVAVINGATKQLETVREINIAPQLVVPDPRGSRTAIVSANAVTIVDSSYKVIETLPGGVSAAFSRRGEHVAVLSASGPDAQVSFTGASAPGVVKLQGTPRAMIALPDGGYLVLVDAGGRGRATKIAGDGGVVGSVEVAMTGGDLVYDAATNRFTVVAAGRFDTAEMPTQVALGSGSPSANASGSASPTSSPTASPSASPESSPASSASPAVAAASPLANVLGQARLISTGLYTLPLPNDLQPQIATTYGSRLWFVDQSNGVNWFDTGTGEVFHVGSLRADAKINFWVAGPSYVFGVDATTGQVNVVDVRRQQINAYATNVLSPVSAVATGSDDRLWIGLRDGSYLLAFDPKTRRMDSLDLAGARISALTIDAQGRILYADDSRETVGLFDPKTSRLNEVAFTRRGATTALLVDNTSTLWLGTSNGEVYAVRGGLARLTVSLQRPISAFATDHTGHAWYLAPLPGGLSGYSYAPADGSKAPRSVAGPAVSLSFNPIGRALLADPRGGIYMSIEGAL